MRPNQVSGVQAYALGVARLLEAAKEQLGPREYEVLLTLHRRWLEAEIRRTGR